MSLALQVVVARRHMRDLGHGHVHHAYGITYLVLDAPVRSGSIPQLPSPKTADAERSRGALNPPVPPSDPAPSTNTSAIHPAEPLLARIQPIIELLVAGGARHRRCPSAWC